MSRSLSAGGAALAFGLLAAPAFGQAIGQGFDLERGGRYADAAAVYLTTLRTDPANLAALLGLERVLPLLSRLPELLPLVQRAREQVPENGTLRGLELRVWAGMNEPDSLEAAARRWAAAAWAVDRRRWRSSWRSWSNASRTGREQRGSGGTRWRRPWSCCPTHRASCRRRRRRSAGASWRRSPAPMPRRARSDSRLSCCWAGAKPPRRGGCSSR